MSTVLTRRARGRVAARRCRAAAQEKARRGHVWQTQRAVRDRDLLEAVRRRDDSTCRYCGREVTWSGRKTASSGALVLVGTPGKPWPGRADFVVGCNRCGATALLPEDRPPLRPEPAAQIYDGGGYLTPDLVLDSVRPSSEEHLRSLLDEREEPGQVIGLNGDRAPRAQEEEGSAAVLIGDDGAQDALVAVDGDPGDRQRIGGDALRNLEPLVPVGDRCVAHDTSPSLDGRSSPSVGDGPVGADPCAVPAGATPEAPLSAHDRLRAACAWSNYVQGTATDSTAQDDANRAFLAGWMTRHREAVPA